MEKDARYFIVGLFVIIGIMALVGFTLWLAGGHDDRKLDRYTVYFTDPVSGLKEGASVQYRGVDVGTVLSVALDPARKDLIKADIEVDRNAPIRGGTEAQLSTLGITGLIYIELSTDPQDETPPKTVESEKYPVITGNGTQLAKIFQDIPTITKQVLDITTKLNTLLDNQNMEKFDATISNVESLTRDLNGLLTPENIANVTRMVENLSVASDDAKGIAERLERTADNVEKAVKQLSEVITTNQTNINKFTTEGLDQITATTRAAYKMIETMRDVAEKLERNPSQIIYKPKASGVAIPP